MTAMGEKADARLRDRVMQQLAHTRDLDAHDIGVRARGGQVTLIGSVRSFPEKVAAAEAVKRLFGVRGIVNEIAVRGAEAVADAELERLANDTLGARAIALAAVTARVTDGCVVLDGTVRWLYQRAAAEAAVAYLPGVRGVDNHIALSTVEGRGPLQDEIEQALLRTAGLDWKRIRVTAASGRVRLTGAVFSMVERDEAERAVWANPGVSAVDNQLDVTSRRWW